MATPPKKTPNKGKRRKKRVSKWRVLLLTLGTVFILTCVGLLGYSLYAISGTPDWHPDVLVTQEQTSFVYDMNNEVVAELHATENRQMVSSEEIPQLVKDTFIAVEDKRFHDHFGVDPIRIVGSLIADLKSQSWKEGASTITMQLANNAFIENPREKTLERKIQQAYLALQLEREYTKEEILTFYLNRIFFGQSSFGIQAAAKTYFGKEVSELEPVEVALLAGLPQAPSAYNPYVKPDNAKKRRNTVLMVMRDADLITAEEYEEYKEAPFDYVESVKANKVEAEETTNNLTPYDHPYFVDHVIEELINVHGISEEEIYTGGLRIYTTLDPKIQSAAEKEFANPDNFPKSVDEQLVQGAITILEPSTGSIRALVGGREYTTVRGLNRATQSNRQTGSIVKPLVVFAPALEKGGYYPGTVLDDMPVKYVGANGQVWAPTNYDTSYRGWHGLITMRFAVQNSVNVYAVKLMNLVGIDYCFDFAKNNLGLPLSEERDKVLSLALGTNEASTLDMAAAYGVFANNGVRVTTHAVERVLDYTGKEIVTPNIISDRVMQETSAYLMNSMLRTVVTNGTGTRAQFGNWAVAGKTGTTSLDPDKYGGRPGNADAWFAGYTPNYVGIVWMGYDKDEDLNHYLRQVYGGGFPAQIWKNVMRVAHEDLPVQSEFQRPAGIVSGPIDTKSGLQPSSLTPKEFIRNEIAARGDFPTRVSDIWIEAEIDADRPEYLAGTGTVNKETKVFLNITDRDPSITWPQDEIPYKMPEEAYNETPPPNEKTSPPAGDANIPTPTLGALSYDASTGVATIPVAYPEGSENLTLMLYIKFPNYDFIQPYTPEAQPGISDLIELPLSLDGEPPPPGKYSIWAVMYDPEQDITGPPSAMVTLTLEE
ncbi:MAG: PBP1A family penicillin-binding protein [Desulfitobacterium sp.]|nr:PBP1A family penicillin-binding protein [Desulfitobacterium sp.]